MKFPARIIFMGQSLYKLNELVEAKSLIDKLNELVEALCNDGRI